MKSLFKITLLLCLVANAYQDRVSADAACRKVGTYYAQGCSGLTAQLLGRNWKSANSYKLGRSIGSSNRYYGVSPGDIVGFRGHVAIYIGSTSCRCQFVDVNGPRNYARCIGGYGRQTVYKAYY